MNIPDIIKLIRPHQWLKNLFIFLPLFFDKHIFDIDYLLPVIISFIAYCLAASSIYCFNDIFDVEADRNHPKKCKRPIASGKVSVLSGYIIMLLLITASVLLTYLLLGERWINVICIILIYYIMNIAYCIKLKHIVLVDVFIISIGFVLRILIGGVAAGIWISEWIVLMTFLLALFLAFAKRRDDVVLFNDTGVKVRNNINRYNLEFINQAIAIIASITMVCYIMYTMSEDVVARMNTKYLYTTSLWVLAGLIRYLQLTIVDVRSGSPTKVLMHDRFIQICILSWVISFIFILYL